MEVTRRDMLAATSGALLSAGALAPSDAEAARRGGDVLYGHGLVWNRELEGTAGELNLSFDMRVNLETGKGFGTAHDPVHPDWNLHFEIETVEKKRRPRREARYTLTGRVTKANNEELVGLPVKIVAETKGDATAVAIRIGDWVFAGAGLVVIAIIASLIALLLPAVQKVR